MTELANEMLKLYLTKILQTVRFALALENRTTGLRRTFGRVSGSCVECTSETATMHFRMPTDQKLFAIAACVHQS